MAIRLVMCTNEVRIQPVGAAVGSNTEGSYVGSVAESRPLAITTCRHLFQSSSTSLMFCNGVLRTTKPSRGSTASSKIAAMSQFTAGVWVGLPSILTLSPTIRAMEVLDCFQRDVAQTGQTTLVVPDESSSSPASFAVILRRHLTVEQERTDGRRNACGYP